MFLNFDQILRLGKRLEMFESCAVVQKLSVDTADMLIHVDTLALFRIKMEIQMKPAKADDP